ncbi:ribonuclease HII [Methylolobus aquaticus]|nr:ribonuclease HII [Methylolobus aquaticus]
MVVRSVSSGPLIAGIDEAGRGALAGPVIAAAVLWDPATGAIEGLDDSKRLPPMRREVMEGLIKDRAVAWAIGRAEAGEVDRVNVLEASMLAMERAYRSLTVVPDEVLVDGNRFPPLGCNGRAVVGGDGTIPTIMAASILAKVARDREMVLLDALYPHYGFLQHKGYPTQAHRQRLLAIGPCAVHRRTFAPVRACIEGPSSS